MLKLSPAELVAVLAHEVFHPAQGHDVRRGGRTHDEWNIGCDLSINPRLRDGGFQLPSWVLFPGAGDYADMPDGLSAEEYTDRLLQKQRDAQQQEEQQQPGDEEKEDEQQQPGDDGDDESPGAGGGDDDQQDDQKPGDEPGDDEGNGGDGQWPGDDSDQPGDGELGQGGGDQPAPPKRSDPGGCGAVIDYAPGSQAEQKASEGEWKQMVAQAMQAAEEAEANGRGDVPGWLREMVQKILNPEGHWTDELAEFVDLTAHDDYSWTRPNRRFISQGLYFPSLCSEEIQNMVVTLDRSGSMTGQYQKALNHLHGILQAYPMQVHVVIHDAAIVKVVEWNPLDGPFVVDVEPGGGTSHLPVFEWIAEQDFEPVAMLGLSDCDSRYPDHAPAFPVLWARVGDMKGTPPFGRVIEI